MKLSDLATGEKGLSFIIPAYNEEKGITDTLRRLLTTLSTLGMPHEIVFVNDGSTDKTKELAAQFNDVQIINHPINIGYGNALKSGIKYAKYEWIGIVDADGSYPIEDISKLVVEMEKGYDMVIGSRSNIQNIDKFSKKLFRWAFKLLVQRTISGDIEDANSGFRLFRKDMLIRLTPFLCGTFSFTTSLTILASGMHSFIKYVPIQYSERTGKSKVKHLRDALRTIQFIVQGITFFNPIKFFLMLAVAMIIIVCIPAMFLALFRMHTLSLYYMIFGTAVALMMGMGVLGDIIRISADKRGTKT